MIIIFVLCFAIAESTIAVIGVLMVLGDDAKRIAAEYAQEMAALTTGKDPSTMTPEEKEALRRAADAVWEHVRSTIPMWKILLIIFVMACTFSIVLLTFTIARSNIPGLQSFVLEHELYLTDVNLLRLGIW